MHAKIKIELVSHYCKYILSMVGVIQIIALNGEKKRRKKLPTLNCNPFRKQFKARKASIES